MHQQEVRRIRLSAHLLGNTGSHRNGGYTRGTDQRVDLAAGSDELPPTNGIKLRLEGGDRIIIRQSGTEPKLKCYLETVAPADGFDSPEDVRTAVAECRQRLSALSAALGAYLGL